jgi:hypothetical protein
MDRPTTSAEVPLQGRPKSVSDSFTDEAKIEFCWNSGRSIYGVAL